MSPLDSQSSPTSASRRVPASARTAALRRTTSEAASLAVSSAAEIPKSLSEL
ncbi:MAG: hypothetical protein QMC36_05360 [Patescibacteria group bacterium]